MPKLSAKSQNCDSESIKETNDAEGSIDEGN